MRMKRYQIREKLREGLFRAEDIQTGRTVIIKESGKEETERILPVHPGICRRTDIFEENDVYLQVFEYIPGRTLKEPGVLSVSQAAGILCRLTEILEELYGMEEHWIYGDLKPSNIIADENGMVCLIDTESLFSAANGTGAGYATKGYAAPEQFGLSPKADERSEVFSIGSIFLELITGVSLKKMNYEIIPAGNVKQPLSGTQAEKVIGKCLRINPAERYQTLQELRTALNELRED